MTDFCCPICGKVGVPDDMHTLMDDRYAPGRCPSLIKGVGNHGNRHVVLIRRDIYDLMPKSKSGNVKGHPQ